MFGQFYIMGKGLHFVNKNENIAKFQRGGFCPRSEKCAVFSGFSG